MISFNFAEIEKKVLSEVKEDYTGFDVYKLVAEKHGLTRNDVKSASFWLFYGSVGPGTPIQTKEEMLKAVENACVLQGLIKKVEK